MTPHCCCAWCCCPPALTIWAWSAAGWSARGCSSQLPSGCPPRQYWNYDNDYFHASNSSQQEDWTLEYISIFDVLTRVMLTWCCLGPWPGPETGAEGGWAAFWTGQRWGGHRHWPGCSGHPGTSPGSLSHCAASVLINTFCSDFLLPLASADRCDWVVSLLTDVAITRYMYRNPVCCSSDGRSTTDDDHWCHPPMAGTSCDRWQLLC